MRIRIFSLIALACALIILSSCDRTEYVTDTENIPPLTESPTTVTMDDVSVTELPITVHEAASENFLLPLEDFSWEREHEVEFVMIHFTSNVVNNRRDPYDTAAVRSVFEDSEVSIHYIIDRGGNIECYIPEDRVAWHAGRGEYGGDEKYTDKMNHYAIGIELLGIGSEADMAQYLYSWEYRALDKSLIGFTDAQYVALSSLVRDICERYALQMDREHVIGHEDYSPTKTDPGELFDWSRILGDNE